MESATLFMSKYDNGFARAQRDYEHQMPPEDDYKSCPTCDGTGEVKASYDDMTFWGRLASLFHTFYIECPECHGERDVPVTEEDIIDKRAEQADRARDEQIDREMN